ncbi:MAG: hypothetical protein HFI29_12965 [Lachnospiraceae bacterium]|nr:hypothetical protein [Lachnospiraceae bacterium]
MTYDKCVIGIDIGGTHSRIGAVALDGSLIHSAITTSKALAAGTPDTAISDLAAYINSYIKQHVSQTVLGIAAGFPRDLLKEHALSMLRHPLPGDTFQLLFSPAGQNAGILGAAQFLFKKLNPPPECPY